MILSYVKVPATHYALQFQQGRIRREGLGLSFFYYGPNSTIVAVPMGSTDAPFAFVESTADFQQVTVQGQLTYRIVDAKKVASLLDFSIDSHARDCSVAVEQWAGHVSRLRARRNRLS